MINDKDLLTPTMARVYAEQGHLRRAARIYEHLLTDSPNQQVYADALGEIKSRLSGDMPADDRVLAGLLSRWIDLEIGYARLKQLESLREKPVRCDDLNPNLDNAGGEDV